MGMTKKLFWIMALVLVVVTIKGAFSVTWTSDSSNFNNGVYNQTFLNGTFVQLNATYDVGTYTSEVFDVTASTNWNNISWVGNYSNTYAGLPLPRNGAVESGSDGVNMTSNMLLLYMNDTAGNLADSSGNSHPTTVTNNLIYSQGGVFTNSIGFDSVTSYAKIPDTLDLDMETGDFSVSAWVKILEYGGHEVVIHHGGFGADGWGLGYRETTNSFWINIDKTTNQNIYGTITLGAGDLDKWIHVVATFDRDANAVLYVNGEVDVTGDITGNNGSINSGEDIFIGSYRGTGWFWNGSIEEVSVFKRALTADEVFNMYKRASYLNFSARSCNDAVCSGESWTNYNTSSPITLSESANQYFQYRTEFIRLATESPTLNSVAVDYDDVVAPILTNVNATPTDTTAEITWTTDENSNSSVNYGINISDLNLTDGQDDSVTSHSVTLSSLTINTTYYYNATSCDTFSNCNTSIIYNFTTTIPQYTTISNVNATSIDINSESITWTTDVNSDSNVTYGLTLALGSFEYSSSLVASHDVTLSGLTSNTFYYYNATSCAGANCNTSGYYNFTTTNASISGITETKSYFNFTISWNTNGLTNSTLEWGETIGLINTTTNSSLVNSHALSVTNLSSDTLYYYRITSCDTGSCDTSAILNITTSQEHIPVNFIVADYTPNWVKLSWEIIHPVENSTVEYSTDNFTWSFGGTTELTFFTITGLTSDLEYYFRVKNSEATYDSEWVYTQYRTEKEYVAGTADLAITIFILIITGSLFGLSAKKVLMENQYSNLIVKRACLALGIFLMIMNSAIMATLAEKAGLGLTQEMFFFMKMFSIMGYPILIILMLTTMFQYFKLQKDSITERRTGNDEN